LFSAFFGFASSFCWELWMLGTLVLLLLCSELGVCFFLCFGDSLVLLLFFFLFWSFGFASFVFYMTESCAFVKFFFLLAFRGWRGKGNKLAVGKKTFPMVLVAWQVSSVSNQRAMDWRS
jgi:hypothetical protein